MPKLEVRKTIELSLPSYPDSKVILYDRVLAGGMERILKAKDDFERGLITLQEIIKDWNFVDEEGKKLEVTMDNLRKLPIEDLNFLLEKVRGFFTQDEKKERKS
ncbi:MAG: hypothetical protein ACTSR2_02080 [Candidatus Hodarchaeales archaeon]